MSHAADSVHAAAGHRVRAEAAATERDDRTRSERHGSVRLRGTNGHRFAAEANGKACTFDVEREECVASGRQRRARGSRRVKRGANGEAG